MHPQPLPVHSCVMRAPRLGPVRHQRADDDAAQFCDCDEERREYDEALGEIRSTFSGFQTFLSLCRLLKKNPSSSLAQCYSKDDVSGAFTTSLAPGGTIISG